MENKEIKQSEFVSKLISELASFQMKIDSRNNKNSNLDLKNKISLVREVLE